MIRRPAARKRPTGLGDVDDAVGDVGDLRLGRAVRQPHVGVDALGCEVAGGQLGYSLVTRTPWGRSATHFAGESSATAATTITGFDVALL